MRRRTRGRAGRHDEQSEGDEMGPGEVEWERDGWLVYIETMGKILETRQHATCVNCDTLGISWHSCPIKAHHLASAPYSPPLHLLLTHRHSVMPAVRHRVVATLNVLHRPAVGLPTCIQQCYMLVYTNTLL